MLRPWHGDSLPSSWPWESYCLGDQSACAAGNCFIWPLGSSATSSIIPPQYVFSQVIEFDPQGTARLLVANQNQQQSYSQTSIPYFIEIGLEPANGIAAPSPSGIEEPGSGKSPGQIVAIQVDGMTGATRTYRP
jgi:hypothetical protein